MALFKFPVVMQSVKVHSNFSLITVLAYAGSSLVTNNNASCFDTFQLSINTSAADFP